MTIRFLNIWISICLALVILSILWLMPFVCLGSTVCLVYFFGMRRYIPKG